eukprot:5311252-Lingulodinium_polyedra.AAC.1
MSASVMRGARVSSSARRGYGMSPSAIFELQGRERVAGRRVQCAVVALSLRAIHEFNSMQTQL